MHRKFIYFHLAILCILPKFLALPKSTIEARIPGDFTWNVYVFC